MCFCARPRTCIGDAHTVYVHEHPCASPYPKSPSKSQRLLGKRNQGCSAPSDPCGRHLPRCLLPHSLSLLPREDQLKACCLSQSGALYHHLPASASIAAVQSWADSQFTANLLHPSVLCQRDAVPPATCLRRTIQQLDRQDKGGTRINPILLRVMFSFGIKSLLVIVCDMYLPFIALFWAVLFMETE